MPISPPDPSTPIWHYVVYVAATLLASLLIPPWRRTVVSRTQALISRIRQ